MFLCNKLVILILSNFALSLTFAEDVDFCSLPSCKPRKHVMCEYSKPGGDAVCGIGHKPYPLTKQQKSNLLDWHNKIRLQVAWGDSEGFPKPVSNMHELSWSTELERYAQRWADQCNTVLALVHDGCRNTIHSSPSVGQNVFSRIFATESDTIDTSLGMLKRKWTKGRLIVPKITEMSSISSEALQVAWPGANSIGCAQTHFTNGTHRVGVVVCNYGGRSYGTPGPKLGASCSDCPGESVCSTVYPGLCSAASQSQYSMLAFVVLCIAGIQQGL